MKNSNNTVFFSKYIATIYVFAIFFLGYLVNTSFGLISFNPGVDWSHHMALIDAIHEDQVLSRLRESLGEFSDYPKLSHYLASGLAHQFNISTLRAIQIVANFSVILMCAITALRIVYIVHEKCKSLNGFVLSISSSCLIFFVASIFFANPNGQIITNFFYSQAFGSAISVLALFCIQFAWMRWPEQKYKTLVGGLLTIVILNATHSVPTIWFAGSLIICLLTLPASKKFVKYGFISIFFLGVVILIFDSGLGTVIKVGTDVAGRGDLNILSPSAHTFFKLNRSFWVIVILSGIYLLLFAYLIFQLKNPTDFVTSTTFASCSKKKYIGTEIREIIFIHSGGLAACFLVILFWLQGLFLGWEENYPAAKFLYLLVAEVGILAAHSFSVKFNERSDNYSPVIFWVAIFSLTLAYLINPFQEIRDNRVDQTLLISAQKNLNSSIFPDKVVFDGKLMPHENYYLSISKLHLSRANENVHRLLIDPNFGDSLNDVQSIVKPSDIRIRPAWMGENVDFKNHQLSNVDLLGRWWPPNEIGRWTSPPGGHVLFHSTPAMRDKSLCIYFVAPPVPEGRVLTAEVFLNGHLVGTEFFKDQRKNRIFQAPLDHMDVDGNIILSIMSYIDGQHKDARDIFASVGVSSMWISHACGL